MGCARMNVEWSRPSAVMRLSGAPKGDIRTALQRYVAYMRLFLVSMFSMVKVNLGARARIHYSFVCDIASRVIRITRATAPATISIGYVCTIGVGDLYVLQDVNSVPILTIDNGYIFLQR